ncbi:hypothetical protein KBC79_00340 [Candidatus Woesebacteria bacterium]|nr:hypothetical protein [Candidatus Woesebacteria bacterium]
MKAKTKLPKIVVKPKLLKIMANPLKQRIEIYPYFHQSAYENFDSLVIAKKDQTDFETEEIIELQSKLESKEQIFDFDKFEVVSMQIDTEKPLRYRDYRGKDQQIGVFVKSAKTENDRLLYHLYKQVDQH